MDDTQQRPRRQPCRFQRAIERVSSDEISMKATEDIEDLKERVRR